jgi:hypothetical protein
MISENLNCNFITSFSVIWLLFPWVVTKYMLVVTLMFSIPATLIYSFSVGLSIIGIITLYITQVASWGAYLMKRNVLAMSFAPRDNHEAQVQFALERGVPAIIGVLGSIRLPYPSRAFDMAQCSRCLIPWTSNGKC